MKIKITKIALANRKELLTFEVYFRNQKPFILDKKLSIFNQAFVNLSITNILLRFRYVKGFDVNSFNNSLAFFDSVNIRFYESSLAFYSNGRLLKTCQDFPSHP